MTGQMKNKRDELMHRGSPHLGHFTVAEKHAFKFGFDSCDAIWEERVKPLVEALESIAAPHVRMSIFGPVTKTDTIIAREALSKFRGEP